MRVGEREEGGERREKGGGRRGGRKEERGHVSYGLLTESTNAHNLSDMRTGSDLCFLCCIYFLAVADAGFWRSDSVIGGRFLSLNALGLIRRQTSRSKSEPTVAFDELGGLPAVEEALGFVYKSSPILLIKTENATLVSFLTGDAAALQVDIDRS